MSEKKEEAWYVYAVVTVIAVVMTYFAYTDYESFVHPDSLGSGKSNKLFLLIFNFIDAAGGRWLVLGVMILIIIFCLTLTIKRFKNRNAN